MNNLLACWDNQSKDNNGNHCHKQLKHFSLFVLSIDGMIGKEALVLLTSLSQLMAEKMDKSISHASGWINGRIKIAATRSYSHRIHIFCLPSPLWDWDLDWDPGLGIGLAQ